MTKGNSPTKGNGGIKSLFLKLEERYQFPVSRAFWHFIVAIGAVAAIVGAVIIAYGMLPVFKEKIQKEAYPKQEEVQTDEVKRCYAAKQPNTNETEVEESMGTPVTATMHSTVNFDTLKKSFPETDYSWTYQAAVYQNRANYWGGSDRVLVKAEKPGLEKILIEYLEKVAPKSSETQQRIVDNLAYLTLYFDVKSRGQILGAATDWLDGANDVTSIMQSWPSLANAVSQKTQNPVGLFQNMANFAKHNPDNGVQVLVHALPILALGDSLSKTRIFKVTTRGYHMIGNFDTWSNATDRFLEMKELHSDVVSSLPCYYKLVQEKNASRSVTIDRIDAKYVDSEEKAIAEAESKKAKRSESRKLGLIIFGIALSTISFFSLMLVLLSIQRTMVRIESELRDKESPK